MAVAQPSDVDAGTAQAVPAPRGSGFRFAAVRIIVRRLLSAIPVLWGVTFLAFAALNVLPGDAAQALLGADATPAQVAKLSAQLHLNQPFLTRYFHWLGDAVQGNLGRSLGSGQTVVSLIGSKLPITLELLLVAFIISLLIALPFGTLAAGRAGKFTDRVIAVVSLLGLSVAPYVAALLAILLFSVKLGWFPALGWSPPGAGLGQNLKTIFLPALSLGLPIGCFYLRLLRADVADQLYGEEYVVTAQAKGLKGRRVLLRHALPNSMFGLITVIAVNAGTLLGGTVIIEQIFGVPGIGQLLYQSIQNRDYPVLEGIVAVFALIVVLVGLIADLLYAVLDPRVRYANGDN